MRMLNFGTSEFTRPNKKLHNGKCRIRKSRFLCFNRIIFGTQFIPDCTSHKSCVGQITWVVLVHDIWLCAFLFVVSTNRWRSFLCLFSHGGHYCSRFSVYFWTVELWIENRSVPEDVSQKIQKTLNHNQQMGAGYWLNHSRVHSVAESERKLLSIKALLTFDLWSFCKICLPVIEIK